MAACALRITVTVDISVPDVVAQIAAGFDRILVERAVKFAGPFTEITTPATRLVLNPLATEYIFTDPDGSDSWYYRWALYNTGTDTTGTLSTPVLGQADEALAICSITELKTNYLFGVDLTNDEGEPFPDSMFEHYIIAAVDGLEHRLDIPLRAIDVIEERHDYFREDYDKYIWVELDRFPLIEINEVKLVLPGEAEVQIFNREWIHAQRDTGQLQLVPGTGTAGTILLGASGAWLPIIYGNNRYIPDVFRITYKAGFGRPTPGATDLTPGLTGPVSTPHPELDRGIPRDIKHAICMLAAVGPFNIAGDLIVGAGIASQSISIDGLSQSVNTTSSATNAGYGARIIAYRAELKDLIPQLERYYKGLRLRVV